MASPGLVSDGFAVRLRGHVEAASGFGHAFAGRAARELPTAEPAHYRAVIGACEAGDSVGDGAYIGRGRIRLRAHEGHCDQFRRVTKPGARRFTPVRVDLPRCDAVHRVDGAPRVVHQPSERALAQRRRSFATRSAAAPGVSFLFCV